MTFTISAVKVSRQQFCFTGKERDTESGNDYFGARYYSSSMGRFMSPDWSMQRIQFRHSEKKETK